MDEATGEVVLADGESGLRATFLPRAGMICASLTHRGEELLAQNAGLEAYVQRGKTMGIPLLYPWANRLAGWSYEAGGRRVELERDPELIATDGNDLPIHGVIGGRQAWEVQGVGGSGGTGGSEERSSLTATLAWNGELEGVFGAFPFEHLLHYEAELAQGGLRVSVTVEASASDRVPVCFGFHPYLSPPGAVREDYEVWLPAMRRLILDERQIPKGAGERVKPWRGLLDGRAWDDGYDSLEAGAEFAVLADGRRMTMGFTAGYDCAQVYSPRGGRFVCFEPMTAPANALASGEGLRVLAPGERHVASWELGIG